MPNVGNFGTLISLVVLGVTWMIVQPLKQSIVELKDSIKELKEEVKVSRSELASMRADLVEVKSSAKAAHKRLDDLQMKYGKAN